MWSRLQLKVRTKTPAFPPTRSFIEVLSQVFQCPPPVNSWKLSLPLSAHLSYGIQKLLVVSDCVILTRVGFKKHSLTMLRVGCSTWRCRGPLLYTARFFQKWAGSPEVVNFPGQPLMYPGDHPHVIRYQMHREALFILLDFILNSLSFWCSFSGINLVQLRMTIR